MSELKALERAMEAIVTEATKREVNKYIVANRHGYSATLASTLDDATKEARRRSWESGEDFGIYSLIATASSDELVNTVKVTTIQ